MKDLDALYKEWLEVCDDLGQDTDCGDAFVRVIDIM